MHTLMCFSGMIIQANISSLRGDIVLEISGKKV